MAMTRSEKISKNFPQSKFEQNIADMADSRIITKNLVYVIGLSAKIANKETLAKKEYFGQYGTIVKMVVNNHKAYNQNSPKGPSYSAYVTYSRPYEASIAILSLDNVMVDGHLIRASFGTTKYCSFYLKKIECNNKDCLFLHKLADQADIISREDLNVNKNIFVEQQLYAIKIADLFNSEIRKKLQNMQGGKKGCTYFPSPEAIYNKEIVKELDPINKSNRVSVNKKKYHEDEKETIKKNLIGFGGKSENNLQFNISPKSNLSGNNLSMTQTNSTANLNLNLQNDLKLITVLSNKQKLLNIMAENTSTSSKEDITYTNLEEKLNSISSNPHKLFQNRETSRFFNKNVEDESPNSTIEIPLFIQGIISKKTSTFLLSKAMKHLEDLIYSDKLLESELKNKNEWAQFIIDNKNYSHIDYKTYDKELIEDFDYINNQVLKKCNKYK